MSRKRKAASAAKKTSKPPRDPESPVTPPQYEIIYHEITPKLDSLVGLKERLNELYEQGWAAHSFIRGPVTVAVVLEKRQDP